MSIVRRILAVLLTLYWTLILYLTHARKFPQMVEGLSKRINDKVAHYLAYGALTGLLFITLWAYKPRWRILPLLVLGIVLVYGVFDERTQPYFGRNCDLYDWFADAAAAITALAVLTPIHRFLSNRGIAAAELRTP